MYLPWKDDFGFAFGSRELRAGRRLTSLGCFRSGELIDGLSRLLGRTLYGLANGVQIV